MTCSTYSGLPSAAAARRGACLLRERRALEQLVDEALGLGGRQGLEPERRRVGLAAAPAGADVEQLGPGHDHAAGPARS